MKIRKLKNEFNSTQREKTYSGHFPAGLTLANGLIIEVEGPIIDSVLIADEVEEE